MYRNSTILYNIIWNSYVYPGNSESRYRIWMTERTNNYPRQLIFEYLNEIEFYFFTSKYYWNDFLYRNLAKKNTLYIICGRIQVSWFLFLPF